MLSFSLLNQEQLKLIKSLFSSAEEKGILLWLQSGWAVDTRLGKIRREHEDIDIAFPADREADYEQILSASGFGKKENADYGFVVHKYNVTIESEPCYQINDVWGFKDFPGACPDIKDGVLDGLPIRCVTWDYMYREYLHLARAIKRQDWRPAHIEDLAVVLRNVSPEMQKELEQKRGQ